MKAQKFSPIVTTGKLSECKEFYTTHLGFRVTWEKENCYLAMAGPKESGIELAFMPSEGCQPESNGAGLTYSFGVVDVDAEHARLSQAGLSVVRPLQDNPWGDRSFVVVDPVGISVYIYSEIAPSEEFAGCAKE